MNPAISFVQNHELEFKKTLHKRINAYFEENNLSKGYNSAMIIKTVVILLTYILPYLAIIIFNIPVWPAMLLYFIMGVGVAGIGMSVMHDANHSAYSGNQTANRLLGYTMNLMGSDAYNWKIKHNKLHHVFTNIYGKDEDIESRAILRFAFASPLKKYHRYQHIYAWFLYSLMTLSMIFLDITKRFRYRRKGITNLSKRKFRISLTRLIISKILYYIAIFAIPILFTSLQWYQVLAGFLIMNLTAGFIMSVIFQMAHVVEGAEQVIPDKNGNVPHSLIIHQMRTTTDFARENKILSWYVGGLNFQTEHHLFPRISHVHYPALSKITEATAKEYNIPYHVHETFFDAIRSHYRTLKKLGTTRHEMSYS